MIFICLWKAKHFVGILWVIGPQIAIERTWKALKFMFVQQSLYRFTLCVRCDFKMLDLCQEEFVGNASQS